MDWLKLIHGTVPQRPPASFGPGDDIRVWFKILEQGKERLGQFEGVVIRCRGAGAAKTFTVRRVTHGEGVERVFPMDAKTISRIEVLRQGHVRRSRLYFLRTAVGKTRIASAETSGTAEKLQDTIPIVDRTADAPPPAEKAEDAVTAGGKTSGGDKPRP